MRQKAPAKLIRLDGLVHALCKPSNIFLRGIERAHPADNRFFLNPGVEEVSLPDFFNGVAGNLREDAIGLDFPDDFDAGNAADLLLQRAGSAVGVFSAAPPKIVREQS